MSSKGIINGSVVINLRANKDGVIDLAGNTWQANNTASTTSVTADKMPGLSNREYVILNHGTGGLYIPKSVIGEKFFLGTKDFTFCFWIRTSSDYPSQQYGMVFSGGMHNAYGLYLGTYYQNSVAGSNVNGYAFCTTNPRGDDSNSLYTIAQSTWDMSTSMHLAVTRSNGTIRLFKDGKLAVSTASTCILDYSNLGAYLFSPNENYFTTHCLQALVDDVVLIKGQALWEDTYTPPAENYLLDNYIISNNNSLYLKQY